MHIILTSHYILTNKSIPFAMFVSHPHSHCDFRSLTFKLYLGSQHMVACAKFDESEVKNAMWNCEGDKSPRPHGFNFFKRNFGTF